MSAGLFRVEPAPPPLAVPTLPAPPARRGRPEASDGAGIPGPQDPRRRRSAAAGPDPGPDQELGRGGGLGARRRR